MARETQTIELPSVSPGTRRELIVHRWGQAGARPKAYLQAAIHADEWPGLLTAHHLTRLLDEADGEGRIAGEIVLLPYANPIGLNQYVNDHMIGRQHLADDDGNFSNFNRDWPDLSEAVSSKLEGKLNGGAEANVALLRAALLEAVSELPETTEKDAHRKVLLGLSVDADCVFDLHCDGEALLHIYADKNHAESLAVLGRDMGALFITGTGTVGYFAATGATPWFRLRDTLGLGDALPLAYFGATIEQRGKRDVLDEISSGDAEHLFRFLMRRGFVEGDPGPLPEAKFGSKPLVFAGKIKAPAAGIIAWKKELGDPVQAGETVAELVDITANDPTRARTSIVSTSAGILFSMHVPGLVRPGIAVGRLATKE